jgi:TIR domain
MAELIPLGVRIQVREALVSFVLREINDLFRSHGFVERDHSVEDQGQRRTMVEQFQARIDFGSPDEARKYLDLVADILDLLPEGDEARDPRRQLRRALARANLIGPDRRLHLTIDQPPEPSEADIHSIWAPDRIRIFFSHVHTVRAEVTEIARILETLNCSCFVAHTQIEGGRVWQEVIEDGLRSCHALAAWVNDGFPASAWTDQEVGWALGRGIPVIPVNAGRQPYGFFGSIQSVEADAARAWLTAHAILRAAVVAWVRPERAASDIPAIVARSVVRIVCDSPSYDSTRTRFNLLALIPPELWTSDMMNELERAAADNSQVRECALQIPSLGRRFTPAPEAIEELLEKIRQGRTT